jgi:hypothetical protein
LALGAGHQQSGFFQLVELQTHGIGAVAKLLGQAAQMALDLGVGEKFKQEFEPGLAGNQGRKNGLGKVLKGGTETASPGHPQLSTAVCFSE